MFFGNVKSVKKVEETLVLDFFFNGSGLSGFFILLFFLDFFFGQIFSVNPIDFCSFGSERGDLIFHEEFFG